MSMLRRWHTQEDQMFSRLDRELEIQFPAEPELTGGQTRIIAEFTNRLHERQRVAFRAKVMKALAGGYLNDMRVTRACLDAFAEMNQ